MSDAPAPDPTAEGPNGSQRTTARPKRGRWPGLVWAIPLAALVIVAYLGLNAFAHRGVNIVVTFQSAEGVRPGDTKVIYRGIEAGHVAKIKLNKDGRRVDLTLRMENRTKPVLVTGTEFWLIGAKPSITDIASIKAAVAGVTIGMYPSRSGRPMHRFVGLEQPPVVPPDMPGKAVTLTTADPGGIQAGSDVTYHGTAVGKVTAVRFTGLQSSRVSVFIQSPYDGLVRPGSLFWSASPVQISLTGGGLSTHFTPGAALAGGVEFDTPAEAEHEQPSPSNSVFPLYTDQTHAKAGPKGPEVFYDLAFNSPTGDLELGSPIRMRGFQIGTVKRVGFVFDEKTGVVSTPVTIGVEPERLHFPADASQQGGDWRPRTDAALAKLLSRGWRVRLVQSPPIVGARSLSLDPVPGAGAGRIVYGGPNPSLPTDSSGDISDLTDKASQILARVNAVPIEQIGQNVRQITDRVNRLVGSPQVSDSIAHLDSTLTQVDQMVAEVKPQVGPLIGKLNQAADQLQQTAASANKVLSGDGATQDASLPQAIRELTDTARSIRSVADYLGRHPEALIKGKAKEHP